MTGSEDYVILDQIKGLSDEVDYFLERYKNLDPFTCHINKIETRNRLIQISNSLKTILNDHDD
tara:strand:+ start:583 stop:771 length:189 start_codon:yes stop_codon:yes gene_type:complete